MTHERTDEERATPEELAFGIPIEWQDAPSCGACMEVVRHSPLPGPCPICHTLLAEDGSVEEAGA